MNINEAIRAELFSHRDEAYGKFQGSLMPTVSPDRIIGVRVPQLRAMAKKGYDEVISLKFLENRKEFRSCYEKIERIL